MVGTDKSNDLMLGTGRYAAIKKDRKKGVRPVSLVDVQHRREVANLQEKLKRQVQNVKTTGEKAPHTNYDIFIHPNATGGFDQTRMAKLNVSHK